MFTVSAKMPPPLRIVMLALALIGMIWSQQARAETPLGIATGFDGIRWKSDAALRAEMEAYAAAGATWFRTDLNWSVVQPDTARRYDWRPFDRMVDAAQAAGLKVLPVVSFAPRWQWKDGRYSAPVDPKAYAKFLNMAVRRYAPRGITAWEVWNEPNLKGFWPNPDPVAYTRLLKAAYPAIKQADRNATVIAGGLSPVPRTDFFGEIDHYSAVDFVRGIYANGGGKSFDALGFHPYSYPHQPSETVSWSGWTMMTGPIRDLMVQNGDADKKIWLTEFGAPTHGSDTAVTEQEQADMIRDAMRLLAAQDWAGPVFWYGYADRGTGDDNPEDWFGLVTQSGRAKPALQAYREAAGAP